MRVQDSQVYRKGGEKERTKVVNEHKQAPIVRNETDDIQASSKDMALCQVFG